MASKKSNKDEAAKISANQSGKSMSTGIIIGIVAVVVLLILILTVVGSYNSLIRSDIGVDNQWAQVQTQYQRRADLIPNLVDTVKGARDFEQETLTQVTAARSAWAQASQSGSQEQQVQAANGLESALSRLLVTVEAYPELKSNQNFLALQDELTNTENKVAVERQRYNEAVTALNTKVRTFPSNIVAALFGIGPRTFFNAAEGAENAPNVEF